MSFWDVERPRFRIERGPKWLAIDETTGLLSGTPEPPARQRWWSRVTLERDQHGLDEAALKWGIEKVVSSGTCTVGSASQSFVVDVGE